jgi:hypothetical protein
MSCGRRDPYANESCSLMRSHREQARERSHKHAANVDSAVRRSFILG